MAGFPLRAGKPVKTVFVREHPIGSHTEVRVSRITLGAAPWEKPAKSVETPMEDWRKAVEGRKEGKAASPHQW
jgi:hypothetical protein